MSKKTLLGYFFALLLLLGAANSHPLIARALAVYATVQGGTGTSTPSGILYGDNGSTNHLNTVTVGSNLTFSGGTLSATGGGAPFPFTPATDFGINTSATTTALWGQNSIFASSSSAYPTFAASQAGAGPVAILMGGNVGIGTTSPYAQLSTVSNAAAPSVVFSGSSPLLQIGSSSPTYGYLANDRLNILDNRNDYAAANFYNLNAGACATADWTAANDLNATALNFADFGHTSSGFTGVGCANNPFPGFGANSTYIFDPSGDINTAASAGAIKFLTGGYALVNERLRITNTGNIGLGTTTPFARLSIAGVASASTNLFAISTTTSGSATTTAVRISSNGNFHGSNGAGIDLGFGVTPPGNGIVASGKVGIGTSSPVNALSVSGGAINVAEAQPATSTNMTINWQTGNQQLIRHGFSATTIGFTGQSVGQKLVLMVCNPGGTGGAITWTGVDWAGGSAPAQTTTANKCDVWSFLATNGTSTPQILGTQSANF